MREDFYCAYMGVCMLLRKGLRDDGVIFQCRYS